MKVIRQVLDARAGILQLLGIALLLSLGVNLVSSGVTAVLGLGVAFFCGLAVILLVIISVAATQFTGLRETVTFDAFAAIRDNEVLDIPRYAFGERLSATIGASIRENEAFSRQWSNDPIEFPFDKDDKSKELRNLDGAGADILREASESVYLDLLSRHLSDFFSRNGLGSMVTAHEREDLLPLLPGNRILELLSSPLENRVRLLEAEEDGADRHFVKITRRRDSEDGARETLIWAGDGQYEYRRLELELPRGVKVSRVAKGHIRIDSPIIRTDLITSFDGYGASLDREFLEYYLGLDAREFYGHGLRSGQIWRIHLSFVSVVKWRGVLTPRGWRLHKWAESFVDEVAGELDQDDFMRDIGWPTARTILHSERVRREHIASRKAQASAEGVSPVAPGGEATA